MSNFDQEIPGEDREDLVPDEDREVQPHKERKDDLVPDAEHDTRPTTGTEEDEVPSVEGQDGQRYTTASVPETDPDAERPDPFDPDPFAKGSASRS